VSGDAALLRVAIRALVDHLRLPAGPRSHVEIRAEAAGGRVLISVGTASPSSEPPAAGAHSGMSLSVAQRIAEMHDGSLTAQSVPGLEDWLVLSLPPG